MGRFKTVVADLNMALQEALELSDGLSRSLELRGPGGELLGAEPFRDNRTGSTRSGGVTRTRRPRSPRPGDQFVGNPGGFYRGNPGGVLGGSDPRNGRVFSFGNSTVVTSDPGVAAEVRGLRDDVRRNGGFL